MVTKIGQYQNASQGTLKTSQNKPSESEGFELQFSKKAQQLSASAMNQTLAGGVKAIPNTQQQRDEGVRVHQAQQIPEKKTLSSDTNKRVSISATSDRFESSNRLKINTVSTENAGVKATTSMSSTSSPSVVPLNVQKSNAIVPEPVRVVQSNAVPKGLDNVKVVQQPEVALKGAQRAYLQLPEESVQVQNTSGVRKGGFFDAKA